MAQHVSRVSITLSGEWEADLRRIAYGMRDFLSDPVELAMNRMLAITDNEIFHEQMARHWTIALQLAPDDPDRDAMRTLIAQARGGSRERAEPGSR